MKHSMRIRFLSIICGVCLTVLLLLSSNTCAETVRKLESMGIDESTQTEYFVVRKIGGMPGSDPCKWGGNLEVIGEVPSDISLIQDEIANQIVEKGKELALKACPRFTISGSSVVELYLFKGAFDEEIDYRNPIFHDLYDKVIEAPWEVYAYWEKLYPRDPLNRKYINAAIRRAELASEKVEVLSNNEFLFLLDSDPKTGSMFWIYSMNKNHKCWHYSGSIYKIFGVIPNNISLLNNDVAQALIIKGAEIALNKCNSIKYGSADISLVPQGYRKVSSKTHTKLEPLLVQADVRGGYQGNNWPKITGLKNYVIEAEKKRLAKLEEERIKAKVKERFDDFVKKYRIQVWPTISSLSSNPFVHEGKVIGMELTFSRMTTATQGAFKEGVIVSNIPKGLLTKKSKVVLAGRVLGNIAVKTPLGGEVLRPHLSFVGVHFCVDWSCKDIIPSKK